MNETQTKLTLEKVVILVLSRSHVFKEGRKENMLVMLKEENPIKSNPKQNQGLLQRSQHK